MKSNANLPQLLSTSHLFAYLFVGTDAISDITMETYLTLVYREITLHDYKIFFTKNLVNKNSCNIKSATQIN